MNGTDEKILNLQSSQSGNENSKTTDNELNKHHLALNNSHVSKNFQSKSKIQQRAIKSRKKWTSWNGNQTENFRTDQQQETNQKAGWSQIDGTKRKKYPTQWDQPNRKHQLEVNLSDLINQARNAIAEFQQLQCSHNQRVETEEGAKP